MNRFKKGSWHHGAQWAEDSYAEQQNIVKISCTSNICQRLTCFSFHRVSKKQDTVQFYLADDSEKSDFVKKCKTGKGCPWRTLAYIFIYMYVVCLYKSKCHLISLGGGGRGSNSTILPTVLFYCHWSLSYFRLKALQTVWRFLPF